MNKRKKIMIVNWIMLFSLLVVMVTGMLLKPMPGMWMGIAHALSGFTLFICAIIHCIQHGMLKRRKQM